MPTVPARTSLRQLISHHLGLPQDEVPDALLSDVLEQVPAWAKTLNPTPVPDWARMPVSMPVIKSWVAARDLEMLEHWLASGPVNERLTLTAWDESLTKGWKAGAQTLWGSDRLRRAAALARAWGHRPMTHAQWAVPWLDTLTWTTSPTVGESLTTARTQAMIHAWDSQDEQRWDTYRRHASPVNNKDGGLLLDAVGKAPVDHPWATRAFRDLVEARAPWGLGMVLNAIVQHRTDQMDILFAQRRCGLNLAQRVLLLCQVEVALGQHRLKDPDDAHRAFEACWAWGLPLEVRLGKGAPYEDLYSSAFPGGDSYIGVRWNPNDSQWQAALQAPRLKDSGDVVHLADHWGFAASGLSLDDWKRPAACEARRRALAQTFEARVLREAVATVTDLPDAPSVPRPRL